MKSFSVLAIMMFISFTHSAKAAIDPHNCSSIVIKAALKDAQRFASSDKVSYRSLVNLEPPEMAGISVYEVNLTQRGTNENHNLRFEVIVRGKKTNCKVVQVIETDIE